MKLLLALAVGGLACQGMPSGQIEGRRTSTRGTDPGPPPQAEPDPAEADASIPGTGPIEDAGTVAGEIGLEQLSWRAARATCRRRLECCPASAPPSADALDACAQDLADLLAPLLEGLGQAVAGGRATYDGAAAARCLSDLETAACPQAQTWEALLLATRCAIAGAAVSAGQDCQASYECIEGYCQGTEPGRAGRCVTPRLADGQPCQGGDDCASGSCHPALAVCGPDQPGNLCDG